MLEVINEDIKNLHDSGEVSDGYHTFDELYEFRLVLQAALFNVWAKQGLYAIHKSKNHYDQENDPMFDGYFIVNAMLPSGQVSNHYSIEHWDLFQIPSAARPLFPFDGHTSLDALERYTELSSNP